MSTALSGSSDIELAAEKEHTSSGSTTREALLGSALKGRSSYVSEHMADSDYHGGNKEDLRINTTGNTASNSRELLFDNDSGRLITEKTDANGHSDPYIENFGPNKIRTSKYTILTFIPLNLFEQLSRPANFYFCIIAVLQSIKAVSISQGVPSILLPLSFVFAVSGLKELLEDWKRHKEDKEENKRPVERLNLDSMDIEQVQCEELRVGDVVRVRDGHRLPADVLLITSAKGNRAPYCYVETSNIDGETNLKMKQSCEGFNRLSSLDGFAGATLGSSAVRKSDKSLDGVPDQSAAAMSLSAEGVASPVSHAQDERAHRQSSESPSPMDVGARTQSFGLHASDSLDRKNVSSLTDCLKGCSLEYDSPNGQLDQFGGMFKGMHLPPLSKSFYSQRKSNNSTSLARSLSQGFGSMEPDALAADVDLAKNVRLSIDNILLRGSELRNSDWIYGMVIYTGFESKIFMNNESVKARKIKRSKVEKNMNRYIYAMACCQVLVCIICATLSGDWLRSNRDAWYLDESINPATGATLKFFTWFIIFAQFIPISLLVSMEIVKYVQAFFMEWDIGMYVNIGGTGQTKDDKFCNVQNCGLNEELGQIEFIFSDKTGTLTENSLDFRKCVIGLNNFGKGETEIGRAAKRREQELNGGALSAAASSSGSGEEQKSDGFRHLDQSESQSHTESPVKHYGSTDTHKLSSNLNEDGTPKLAPHVNFDEFTRLKSKLVDYFDKQQQQGGSALSVIGQSSSSVSTPSASVVSSVSSPSASMLGSRISQNDEAALVKRFLTVLAINNSCFPVTDEETGQRLLRASSPDDECLTCFSQFMGVILAERNPPRVSIEYDLSMDPLSKQQSSKPRVIREEWEQLAELEFTSKRKRMTVIAKNLKTGMVHVSMKGADSEMKRFIKNGESNQNWPYSDEYLTRYSEEGLRTLVVAEAILSEDDWWLSKWKKRLAQIEEATVIYSEKEKGHRKGSCSDDCRICCFYEDLELSCQCELLGVTAIEDKLQVGVPETISICLDAGINVWVLTGDKQKTAENIGIACNLLEPRMERDGLLFRIVSDDPDVIQQQMQDAIDTCIEREVVGNSTRASSVSFVDGQNTGGFSSMLNSIFESMMGSNTSTNNSVHRAQRRDAGAEAVTAGMVVSSAALHLIFDDEDLTEDDSDYFTLPGGFKFKSFSPLSMSSSASSSSSVTKKSKGSDRKTIGKDGVEKSQSAVLLGLFLELTRLCKSVIGVRLQPNQKRQVIDIIRAHTGAVSLAIGDGANDEPMIRTADVGVGIAGLEGTAAIRASDYAIGRFCFLQRLLFIHGRLNYIRISTLICFIFYKNGLLSLSSFWFGLHNGFSGQIMYLEWAYQLYNVAFTMFPIMVYSVIERDAFSDEVLLKSTDRFYKGLNEFNGKIFAWWIIDSLVQSCLLATLPLFLYANNTSNDDTGQSFGIWSYGVVTYTGVVFCANLRLCFVTKNWTSVTHFALWFSLVTYFVSMLILNATSAFRTAGADYYRLVERLLGTSSYWLTATLVTLVSLFVPFSFTALREMWIEKEKSKGKPISDYPR